MMFAVHVNLRNLNHNETLAGVPLISSRNKEMIFVELCYNNEKFAS